MSETLIIKMQFGSHVYGTNLPTSDYDIKCVAVPPARNILLQQVCESKNESTKKVSSERNKADDIDNEIFSLQKYLTLLLQGQTVAHDMLFAPAKFYLTKPNKTWLTIQENKNRFFHSGVSAFAGYCKQQANKYGIKGSRVSAIRNMVNFLEEGASKYGEHSKLADCWDEVIAFVSGKEFISIETRKSPDGIIVEHLECCNRLVPKFLNFKGSLDVYRRVLNAYGERAKQAESNDNVDWKALMHAVRVCEQAKEFLLSAHVTFPRPEAALLLQIRKGELPYKQVAELIENGLEELNEAQLKSTLPTKPDYNFAEDIILEAYRHKVMGIYE
jgi:hypothetical protein